MKNLQIYKIDNFTYYLKDELYNTYKLKLELYDLDENITINDYIIINEELLQENGILSFGSLDSIYGKKLMISNDKDIMILIKNNKTIYLKRLYG